MNQPDELSVAQAAKALGISKRTLYSWWRRGASKYRPALNPRIEWRGLRRRLWFDQDQIELVKQAIEAKRNEAK